MFYYAWGACSPGGRTGTHHGRKRQRGRTFARHTVRRSRLDCHVSIAMRNNTSDSTPSLIPNLRSILRRRCRRLRGTSAQSGKALANETLETSAPTLTANARAQALSVGRTRPPPGVANPERGRHADCQRKRTCVVVSPERAGRDHGPSTGDQRETTNGRPRKHE